MLLTKNNFNISRAKFYYLNRKVWSVDLTFAQAVEQLDSNRFESRFDPFPLVDKQIPDLFVTSSQQMLQNFKVAMSL